MFDKLFDNPCTAFLVVATVITITILLLRLLLKSCVLLWKSIFIPYIIYVAFAICIRETVLTPFEEIVFKIFGPLLLIPGMLFYGLIPGVIKPCPSDFDEFGWLTFGFLFYVTVIWGIMKFRKHREEMKAAEKKQDANVGKQTPTENEA